MMNAHTFLSHNSSSSFCKNVKAANCFVPLTELQDMFGVRAESSAKWMLSNCSSARSEFPKFVPELSNSKKIS